MALFICQVRLPTQSKNERNFHIFYQMCRGGSDEEKEHWELEGGDCLDGPRVSVWQGVVLNGRGGDGGHGPHG